MTTSTASEPEDQAAKPATRRRPKPQGGGFPAALPWLAPALLLILVVVVFPAGYMIYNSMRHIGKNAVDDGWAEPTRKGPDWGVFSNFGHIFTDPNLPRILLNSLVWVVVVVVFTVVISLVLAQFLSKPFPGRRLVRMAVVVPWAASVVMTTTVFYYAMDPNYGTLNHLLEQLHLVGPDGFGFTKSPVSALGSAMAIAVFVSLPFTIYTLLAGIQSVPADTIEAAKMDGAGRLRTYFSVVLPQLRNSLAVAVLINMINVFNNLPILQIMTKDLPGYESDTLMTYIFKTMQFDKRIDWASALSVLNFAIVALIVLIYVRVVKPLKEV
ncbi:carbohydrate ABC transporter permease [Galactobacter caseinivorans]|uniref:Sugar ABC transporter permease n=1 Tax=Galactobacter caseinivorans TaxID=2676123 RepID=A0A496PGG1_9MICC|nr:sugar ABC transporter permease [Galactobacter caseinivorans]RKW69573.1 sugar ABC transporter permease [Galactobacter caseinivorans]